MLSTTSKNTRHGSLPGNGCGGFITAMRHPSPGSFVMRKIEYQKGEQIGSCIYLEDAAPYITSGGAKIRKALFLCECGNMFEAIINHLKNGNTTSCGCYHRKRASELKTTHGMCNHSLYYSWNAMINRCYNKNHNSYKNYGGRGITICPEWRHDFKAYFDHVTELPGYGTPGLTIDRIKNNEGYKFRNLRWATRHQQAMNRRCRLNSQIFENIIP